MRRVLSSLIALSMITFLAGCGDDDEAANVDAPVEDAAPGDADSLDLDDMVESQEAAQDAQGGGNATITIGDQTWEFDSVLCAVGPGETGREDTEFVLSSIQDGLQLDATINTEFGHSISLNDIEDLQNPSVSYGFTDVSGAISGDIAEVIQIDGKDVYAEGAFYDDTSDAFEEIPGTLTATCP